MPHPKPRRPWQFHPFELAVNGYPSPQKTDLVEALIRRLSVNFRLAYLKYDDHDFAGPNLDKPSRRIRQAGATTVLTCSRLEFEQIGGFDAAEQLLPYGLLAADALIVEDCPAADVPRLLVLDKTLAVLDDPAWKSWLPPKAVVSPAADADWTAQARQKAAARFGQTAWFDAGDLDGICRFAQTLWQAAVPPLCGLVLSGGRSSRMGTDKAALDYHGQAQLKHAYGLLGTVCSTVLVSCRPDQTGEVLRKQFPLLADRFLDLGPAGGILSALAPANAAYLVLACDMPLVNQAALVDLVAARNPYRFATAYQGSQNLAEPLLAIWEPKAYPRLLQFIGLGYDCPRKCLINSPITLITPADSSVTENANAPDDRQRMLNDLGSRS